MKPPRGKPRGIVSGYITKYLPLVRLTPYKVRGKPRGIKPVKIKESVIHRFEICYDSFFKALKKYLQESAINVDSGSPRAILRKACDMEVMDQEALANWFSYIDLRIGTAHDYSETKAEKALSKMGEFIEDVEDIYKVMCSAK